MIDDSLVCRLIGMPFNKFIDLIFWEWGGDSSNLARAAHVN